MIRISGTLIPAPSGYSIGIMDISKAERNAAGTMVIDRIATKRKIDIQWAFLSREDASQVLKLVAPVFFEVEYTDPQDDVIKTGMFYCGDRKAGALGYQDGVIWYKDISFNLIER